MIALPAQVNNKSDEAEEAPNTATHQHGGVRRTTQDVGVAGGSKDADQLAHRLASPRKKAPHAERCGAKFSSDSENRQRQSTPVQHFRLMLSVRDNTWKSRRQHKRSPERKRVPSRQVSCPLLAQNGHRGLFCLEGIAEDLARFRVHKMDLLTRETGHSVRGVNTRFVAADVRFWG